MRWKTTNTKVLIKKLFKSKANHRIKTGGFDVGSFDRLIVAEEHICLKLISSHLGHRETRNESTNALKSVRLNKA